MKQPSRPKRLQQARDLPHTGVTRPSVNPETRIAMSRHIATAVTSAIVATILLTGVAAGRSTGWGQQPPTNLTPPAISGTVRVGSSLTGSTGTWQRVSSYAFQWLRCNSAGASCGPIAGASASTYAVSSPDAGYTLRVLVTASNKNGTAAAVSAATQVVPS